MKRNVNVSDQIHRLRPMAGVAAQSITVSNAVVQLAALNENTVAVQLQVQDQPVRISFDGVNPTTTLGFVYAANSVLTISAQAAAAMKMIRSGGTDAVVYAQELTK